jgi:hypothetical protein
MIHEVEHFLQESMGWTQRLEQDDVDVFLATGGHFFQESVLLSLAK